MLNQIEEVSIDLWIPYKSLIQEMMPNAQVVADRFHVMKQINNELDEKRKKEKRAAEKIKNKKKREEKIAGLVHSKYPLLKKKENLNDAEKAEVNVSGLPPGVYVIRVTDEYGTVTVKKIVKE